MRMKQEDEIQCQDCDWWKGRNGNACFPRTITYVLAPINKTAMPAHEATFTNCPHKQTGNNQIAEILMRNKQV